MAAARMRESVISSTSSILMENPKKFFFRAVDRKMLGTSVRAILSWNADRNGGRMKSVFKF